MKNKIGLLSQCIVCVLCLTFAQCSKKDSDSNITPPTVTTQTVNSITATTAYSGGRVTLEGGSAVSSRGVCWSLSSNPTIQDNKTSDGMGPGTFSSNMTRLSPNTKYYVRAYATNSGGTSYGDILNFTTLSGPSFTVTYVEVELISGMGVQFYASCNNEDIQMTNVIITNPSNSQTIT